MKSFCALVVNDLVKVLNTKELLFLFIASFGVMMLPAAASLDMELLTRLSKTSSESNFVTAFGFGQYGFLSCFGVIFSNLILVLLVQLERDNNMWKTQLVMPVDTILLVYSKLLAALLVNLLLCVGIFALICFESLMYWSHVSETPLTYYFEGIGVIAIFLTKFFVVSTGVLAFHLMVHLLVSNKTILILISVFMPIVCLFNFASYIPYGWTMENFWTVLKNKTSSGQWQPLIGKFEILAISLFLVVILLAHLTRNSIYRHSKFYR